MKAKIAFIFFMMVSSAYASVTQSADNAFHSQSNQRVNMAMSDKSSDQVLQALISETVSKFQLKTYSDDKTGLSIQYNIFFPESCSEGRKYPAVFFIADASAAGRPPEYSLTQGCGGIIWASRGEQSRHEAIVIVPVYPGVILDDHDGFILTEYVDLTARFLEHAIKNYSIDSSRVYVTGQSMGCMTFLNIAAKYPGLVTASLFVSGQWDISQLEGLASQKFIYAASAGDSKASAGQYEVIDMFKDKGVPFVWYSGVDAKNPNISLTSGHEVDSTPTSGTSGHEANTPALSLTTAQQAAFITFMKGSTLQTKEQTGAQEHMTSFDYAYKIQALRDWLFSQIKE